MPHDPSPCPHCRVPRTHPPLPEDTNLERRVVKFEECACGAIIRISTREGWERWYDLDWTLTGADPADPPQHPQHFADRAEFYARLTPS